MKKLLVFLLALSAVMSSFSQTPVPAYKPRLIPYADWDQYHNLLGADNALVVKGLHTNLYTPTNTWGAYHLITWDLTTSKFQGWSGSQWVDLGCNITASDYTVNWYHYTACGGGYSTTALAELQNGQLFGGCYRAGLFYRPAQGNTPGYQECRFDPVTGTVSFSTAGPQLTDGEHIDIGYLGGTAGTFYSGGNCCIGATVSGADLVNAVAGTAYSSSVAINGTTPLTLSNIIKPSWMTIAASGGRVYFTGTPSASAGPSAVTFTVNNSCGNAAYASTITVDAAPVVCTPVQLPSITLDDAQAGTAYSKTITITTGTAPYTLGSVTKPAWMSVALNNNIITLTGTPSTGGVISAVAFTVSNCGGANIASFSGNITVNDAPVVCTPVSITPTTLAAAYTGVAYSQTIPLSGTAPFTISNVVKPSWMAATISGSSVVLVGTPSTAAAAAAVSFTVSNCTSSTANYSGTVTVNQSITAISGTFQEHVNDDADPCHSVGMGYPTITLGQTYSQDIVLQIAFVSYNQNNFNNNDHSAGIGGDIVPSTDAYYTLFTGQQSTYYPAQITIPAGSTTYTASGSDNFSSSSFLGLRKDGQVLDLVSGDKVGEHGSSPQEFPDCNPTFGISGSSTNKTYVRYYYKVVSPSTVNLTLSATTTSDISSSRMTMIKVP